MKIVINCPLPFYLTHGGQQIQVQKSLAALRSIGIDAEPARWWDENQKADIVHFFGRMPADHIEMAHQRGIKVVMGELLTGQGSRSPRQLFGQRLMTRAIQRFAPRMFSNAFNWRSYHLADAIIAMTPWEKHLMHYTFNAPCEKISIIGNGVEEVFLQPATPAANRDQWLVCTATITARKRVLELAKAAVQAEVPLWVIGKPYSDSDPYAQEFQLLVKNHPKLFCRESPPFDDREGLAEIYRNARGFVLLSAMETRSLAAEEAAACECPLMLSDLPWARSTFGDKAQYCPVTASTDKTAAALRAFYDAAPSLPRPPKPPTWIEIAEQLKAIYKKVLA